MAEFVNPYTFVPHVAVPERKPPAGHALMAGGRFSGLLKVTVTAKTPLLIGGFTRDEADGSKSGDLPRRRDPAGRVMIPGSGLMGAVRSVHEALTGGCMRVLDLNRVPVHRHPANMDETENLHLAVVTRVDSGKATQIALCDRWHWVPAGLLPGGEDDPVCSGDQLEYTTVSGKPGDFPGKAVTGPATRRVVHSLSDTHPDGILPGSLVRKRKMGPVAADCKVVLVTDTNARNTQRPLYFVVGNIGPDSRRKGVEGDAQERYLRTVEGADDLRPEALKKAGVKSGAEPAWGSVPPEYADVWWPPRPEDDDRDGPGTRGGDQPELVGQRLRARTYLHVGQPVWVAVSGDKVTEIRLSLLWRYEGHDTVGVRVGEAKGCTDPRNLCWSCRIFGAADTEGRDKDDLAVQNSYRGHVRIDDLLAEGHVEPITWDLAPLASPKPGAGQFYLDNKNRPGLADQNTRPAAAWGSVADDGKEPRSIRGRKFYWRTDTQPDPASDTPQRGKKRPHQSAALSSKVSLIPAGTVFTGRIAFDNLDAEDYGSLLAALDPRRLGAAGEDGWGETVISVGGGKPFGFGCVEIGIEAVRVQGAFERYLGEQPEQPVPSPDGAVRAFVTSVKPTARANWQALRHALTFGFVADEDVWYPPGSGERGSADYDKSFEFFTLTQGLRFGEGTPDRPLVSLPDVARGRKDQKLNSPAGQRRRGGTQAPGVSG